MPKPKAAIAPMATGPNNALSVPKTEEETESQAIARKLLAPDFRHAMATGQLLKTRLAGLPNAPGSGDFADAINARCDKAAKGDLKFASRMLAAQASTLDAIFAEMAQRMAENMGGSLAATEIYARIAMKAQANSRAALEALAKLHQPREQTVRHVHVNEGGQAVIADQFHHHTGGQENGKPIEQPHATGSAGECLALPGPDPRGTSCQSPAVRGQKRCRMHGGKGSGAPDGNRNAWKHGGRSAETRKVMAAVRKLAAMLE